MSNRFPGNRCTLCTLPFLSCQAGKSMCAATSALVEKSSVSMRWLWIKESFIQTSMPYGPCVKRSPSKRSKPSTPKEKGPATRSPSPYAAVHRKRSGLPSTVPVVSGTTQTPRNSGGTMSWVTPDPSNVQCSGLMGRCVRASRNSKCKWGPKLPPVLPLQPMVSPAEKEKADDGRPSKAHFSSAYCCSINQASMRG